MGQVQSPVALESESAEEADLPSLQFDYGQASLEINETGYSYTAMPNGNHTLQIGGDSYRLLQFHPHTPSEHTIDGEQIEVFAEAHGETNRPMQPLGDRTVRVRVRSAGSMHPYVSSQICVGKVDASSRSPAKELVAGHSWSFDGH